MINPFSLEGKTIVITGASSGIGRQCAISCSQMGAKVVAIGRNEERLDEVMSMLINYGHMRIVLDLTNYEEVSSCVSEITNKYGRIDGLVNCAGISTTLPLKLMSHEKILQIFNTNLFSAINLVREFCKVGRFNNVNGGSIIFLSSVMGMVGENGKTLYGMTKAALIGASRSLACELAKKKIRVNAISPGVIITPINENLPHIADAEQRITLENKHLLGLGNVYDVANACIYLLSDASRWVTGSNMVVDGGYTVK